MIPRELEDKARQAAGWMPVVSVTGPRQSGKSTLVRHAFPAYEYVNLERPDTRAAALDDPIGFIRNRPARLIIDEAQYAPELFSVIQALSDERDEPGQYVLSGSQNFLLLKQIKQSLADRVGLLRLMPLSFAEAQSPEAPLNPSVDEFMLRGGYPRLYGSTIDLGFFFENYVDSYVERDVSEYLDVRDLTSFQRFLRLCAQRVGSPINLTGLANDTGVSFRTAKSWLSILESSYLVTELLPYHANAGKRLTKTAKLYFMDTGLLCHLLGIGQLEQLLTHEALGAVFENLVISETVKHHLNAGRRPELYFYRDESRREVDLLDFTNPQRRTLMEIKPTETYRSNLGRHLTSIGEELGIPPEQRSIVYRGSESLRRPAFAVCTAGDYLRFSAATR